MYMYFKEFLSWLKWFVLALEQSKHNMCGRRPMKNLRWKHHNIQNKRHGHIATEGHAYSSISSDKGHFSISSICVE